MKKLTFLVVFAVFSVTVAIGGAAINFTDKNNAVNNVREENKNIEEKTKEKVLSEQSIADPTKLVILKLGVEASVEKVGVDNQGRMDVPKSFYNVGWYKYGARPGEKGNAVIAGHYDTVTGTDAVFFNLSKLEVGDELKVIDESGAEYDYKVSQINTYLFNQVPLNYVFGNTDKSRLNLITCSGVFDRNTRNYSHRTIVYSDLISSSYPNP